MVLTHGVSHPAPHPTAEGADISRRRKYLVSASIRSLPPDNHPDERPSSAAKLSIVLEPAPIATIGELVRDLAGAILIAVSGRTQALRKDGRQKISQGESHPPG
jgi:hypothetical protein